MRYRKKPVVIEAWPTSALLALCDKNWDALPKVVIDAYERGDVIFANDHILINTLEGVHRADFTDMVICGVKQELYPCKKDIFDATYEVER